MSLPTICFDARGPFGLKTPPLMISAANITVFLGGRKILDNATFRVGDSERAAIVGPNGAGKSTLLKAVAGLVSPEAGGEIALPKGATIGYLPQVAQLNSARTIRDEMRSVFAEALMAFSEMTELEHQMGEVDHVSEEFQRIAKRYDYLMETIHRLDAYAMDSHIGVISAGLGFKASDLDRACGEFSGGWQMRVELAKVLLARPGILLLDEPTNHLDLESIQWLEDWIMSLQSSVLFVSHERSFMDRLADRIFEISRNQLTIYKGNYTDYLDERDERRVIQQRAFENQQREIEKAELFISRFRYQANKAASVQSRVKMLDKVERLHAPEAELGTIHFKFPQPPRSGKEVVTLENVAQRYGNLTVFENVNRIIYRGEKVALVGVNGAGKSTLMKIVAGLLEPTEGRCFLGSNVAMQYFAQYEHDVLHPSWTVQQALYAVAPIGEAQKARDVAGAFLFTGEDVEKPVTVLSGGERTRLRLAMMLFSPSNLLLLDEPTNHLDIGSRQTLEDALKRYDGTLVMVSHDRTFVDKVATRIIEVHNGKVEEFWGAYRDYLKKHLQEMGLAVREFPEGHHLHMPGGASGESGEKGAGAKDNGAAGGGASSGASGGTSKSAAKSNFKPSVPTADEQKLLDAVSSIPRKMSRQERQSQKRESAETRKETMQIIKPLRDRVRSLEKNIEEIEASLAEIAQVMSDPATYANPQRVASLGKEKKTLEAALADIMKKWEKAAQELQEAQNTK
ncbi:MAG: ATP-binding cassette domain-containing protein [Candidatus Sumerlaeota bacterium]|nr:ATP-binding cassette domain-containing protein [Candidatus Sumerlaeota bacterium]